MKLLDFHTMSIVKTFILFVYKAVKSDTLISYFTFYLNRLNTNLNNPRARDTMGVFPVEWRNLHVMIFSIKTEFLDMAYSLNQES